MFYLVRKDDTIVAGHATTDGYFVNGMDVVSVPNNVSINEGALLELGSAARMEHLLEEKYSGILKNHPIFSNKQFFVFGDPDPIDVSPVDGVGMGFGRRITWLNASGFLITPVLTTTSATDRFLFQWDVYSLEREEGGVRYVPEDPDLLTVDITNTVDPAEFVTNEEVVVLPSSGTEIAIRFTNNTGRRLYIGGFCLLY